MIVIYSGTANTHLRILAIDEADSISQFKDEDIELPVEVISRCSAFYCNLLIKHQKIISASCNPSGYLSILSKLSLHAHLEFIVILALISE